MGLGLRAGGRMNNNNTDNNEWLNEGCQELAKAGLRTLVFASRVLTEQFVTEFLQQYEEACAIVGSEEAVGPGTANADPANAGSSDGYKARRLEAVLGTLETDMKLIGITGVEDELQDDVVFSIETLSMCGLKIWVLTGDKIETATTIARATRLIPRNGTVETLLCLNSEEAWARLRQLQAHHDHITTDAFLSGYTGNDSSGRGGGGGGGDGLAPSFQPLPPSSTSHLLDYVNDASLSTPWTLILDGFTLDLCLTPGLRGLFVAVAQAAHAVVIARCSPTQKAMVVRLMKDYSDTVEKGKLRTAAIGDGGNDVSMILEAHVGIGLEGKEGRQASMAADFSLTKFAHLTRLVTWHGRNSYHRTCLLSQFIMHRGMIYSVMQAFYCALLSGAPKALFNGYLLMGYSTLFTMAPAFALILDEDAREEEVREYPFLYRTLVKSRAMNLRSFLEWVWVSIFQGGILTFATFFIFDEGTERAYAASIAYGALLVTEFVMVGAGVHLRVLWHQRRLHFFLFFLAEAVSILFFVIAVFVLPDTFDAEFLTAESLGRVLLLGLLSVVPVMLLTVLARGVLFNPRVVAKCCR